MYVKDITTYAMLALSAKSFIKKCFPVDILSLCNIRSFVIQLRSVHVGSLTVTDLASKNRYGYSLTFFAVKTCCIKQ